MKNPMIWTALMRPWDKVKIEKTDGLTVRFLHICLDYSFLFFKFPDMFQRPLDDLLVDGAALILCHISDFGEKPFVQTDG